MCLLAKDGQGDGTPIHPLPPDAALAVLHEFCCCSAGCGTLHRPGAARLHAGGASACSELAPSTSCITLLAAVDAFDGPQQHASLVAFTSSRCNQRLCGTSGDPVHPREVTGCVCICRECTGPGVSFTVKRMSIVPEASYLSPEVTDLHEAGFSRCQDLSITCLDQRGRRRTEVRLPSELTAHKHASGRWPANQLRSEHVW